MNIQSGCRRDSEPVSVEKIFASAFRGIAFIAFTLERAVGAQASVACCLLQSFDAMSRFFAGPLASFN